ncbi:MAG: hypothetical protein U5K54_18530 [Cytophagales bacterium]|nr:hypothetical protein [Cytophagales bacterium]
MKRRISFFNKTAISGLVLGAILFCSQTTLAQAKQTARFELEQKGSDTEYIVISLKEAGLLLIRRQ